MGHLNDLAKKLNGLKNPSLIGVSIGEVTQVSPTIRVKIADGLIDLEEGEELTVCETLKAHTLTADITYINADLTGTMHGTVTGDNISGGVVGTVTGPVASDITGASITIHSLLSVGDLVLVIPAADEQTWFLIDKVGG